MHVAHCPPWEDAKESKKHQMDDPHRPDSMTQILRQMSSKHSQSQDEFCIKELFRSRVGIIRSNQTPKPPSQNEGKNSKHFQEQSHLRKTPTSRQ